MRAAQPTARASTLRRCVAFVGLALVVASAMVLVTGPPARAEGARTITAEPADDLGREVVKVRWAGFTPSRQDGSFGVIIVQCPASPTTLADCHLAQPFPLPEEGNRILGFTGGDGSGSAYFEVRPATDLPALDCSATTPCSILAYENDGIAPPLDALPTTAVIAPIRFGRSPADCPPVVDFDLRADGSASAAPAFYRWAGERCDGADAQVIDYTETSSTTGRENFLAGLVDLGVTPVPASDEELAAHPDHPEFAYAPLDITAVTIVFNMKDPFTGERIEDLVLSPRLVARLVTNSSTESWLNDPELRRLNPTTRFPSTSVAKPLLRAERDADARFLTDWMSRGDDAEAFLDGNDRFRVPINPRYRDYSYPVELFEAVDDGDQSYLPRTGQNNVALRAFYGVAPNGSLPQPPELYGFVGVVDLPTARRFGLPAARIINAAGEAIAPTEAAVIAGFEAMVESDAGTLLPDFTTEVAGAYPLVKVDYAMVPIRPESDEQAGQLRGLLEYAVEGGQDVLPKGYLPLPDRLRDETREIADGLVGPAAATTTTTVTTTSVPPPTTPFDPNCCSGGYDGGGNIGGGAGSEVTTATTRPATEPTTTTTAVDDTTTTTAYSGAPLPVRGERVGLSIMLGGAGLSMIGWAGAGARQARARQARARLRRRPAAAGRRP